MLGNRKSSFPSCPSLLLLVINPHQTLRAPHPNRAVPLPRIEQCVLGWHGKQTIKPCPAPLLGTITPSENCSECPESISMQAQICIEIITKLS